MSKLNELIQKLCPDEVEYKTLGELGKFYGGITGKSKDDFTDGNAKFITYKNVYSNPALDIDVDDKVKISDDENQRTLEYGDVIFTGSSETPDECGISSVLTQQTNEKLYLNSFCFVFRFNDTSIMLPNFSKHLFRSSELRYQIGKTANGVTRFNVSKKLMEKVKIPVPPLEVQREIVRILDSFTLLTAELTAELTARKKQYEFYRDELLKFDNDIQMVKLGELCKITRGIRVTRSELNGDSGYPVYQNSLTPMGYYNKPNRKANTSFVISAGAAGEIGYSTEDYWAADDCLTFECPSSLNDRFLYHFFKTKQEYLYSRVRKASIPRLSREVLEKLEIPFLPIEIQNRLVSVLDKFDIICSDLNIGLPAEIKARQKQYEYYRDKLLNFKKLEK